MKLKSAVLILGIFVLIIFGNKLQSANNMYIRGEFNSWQSNYMNKQVGGSEEKWLIQWRGTTNGISGNKAEYLEYKFDPDGAWGGDSFGETPTNQVDYGTNIISLLSGGGGNILKTNVKIGYPYIFGLNATASPNGASSCELITNISLCGIGFFQITSTNYVPANWTADDNNNLMNILSVTEFSKYIMCTNTIVSNTFKFVPDKSWTNKVGLGWAFGYNVSSSPAPATAEGTAYTIDSAGNLSWRAEEKGVYNVYFNIVTGNYKIRLSGGQGTVNANINRVSPGETGITITNRVTAVSNEIPHIKIIVPSTWGSSFTASSPGGTVKINGNVITVTNFNLLPGNSSYVVINNLTAPAVHERSVFTNRTISTNKGVNHYFDVITGSPEIIVDTLPQVYNLKAEAPVTFASNNLSVKLNAENSFTLKCTYKDKEGDKPGYVGFGTNFVVLNIFTNTDYYGSLAVYTNGGPIDYVNGYEFTFTSTATENHVFSYQGMYEYTNNFLSLCSNYNVLYVWGASEANGYMGDSFVENPSNFPAFIKVDNSAPAAPSFVRVKSNEIFGNGLEVVYEQVTNSDFAYYVVEYGTNKSVNLIKTNTGYSTNVWLYPLLSNTKYYVRVYAFDDVTNVSVTAWYSNTTLDAKPVLEQAKASAPFIFGTNNISVKGTSRHKITLNITYKDIEGDKPGYRGNITNAVFITVYTNNEEYGNITVKTDSGTIDYVNGYEFTFETGMTDDILFWVNGIGVVTNNFKSLCSSYTSVRYQWVASAVTGNSNGVVFPTSSPYAEIIVDDTPPAQVSVTVNPSVHSANVVWNKATEADIAGSFAYKLEWGVADGAYSYSSGWLSSTVTNYTVSSLSSGKKYYYRLSVYDNVSNFSTVTGNFETEKDATALIADKIAPIISGLNLPDLITADNIAQSVTAKDAMAFPVVADKDENVLFTYVSLDVKEIKIYSITGNVVYTISAENIYSIGDTSIGVLDKTGVLSSGIYFAVYKDGSNTVKTVKFVYGIKEK